MSCTGADHLSMNSKCYRKFDRQLSWFVASNDCLSRGGSLAVFTDIGRPWKNSQLTQWLSTDKTYWIGLVRSWWKTTNEGKFNHSLKILRNFSCCCYSLYIKKLSVCIEQATRCVTGHCLANFRFCSDQDRIG